jgi:hypothetical protein
LLVAPATFVCAAEDAAPPDIASITQALKSLREQQAAQEKAQRQKALQEISAAAANPAHAAALWEQAERVMRDPTAYKTWKEKEGDALTSKEVLNALRLHFNWLQLTLQRANGAQMRDLLPAVIAHTKEVAADQAMMEAFEEQLKRAKELAERPGGRNNARQREQKDDEVIKELHNKIVSAHVKGSVVAQWLKLEPFVSDAGAAGGKGQAAPNDGSGWEGVASNVDGIFQSIILPELRKRQDPRIVEYWDNKLRKEAEAASKTNSGFEMDKFNTINRPQILWDRARDIVAIGQKNKGAAEMFTVIKGHPAHPNSERWMKELETVLGIAPPAPPAGGAAQTAAPAPAAPPAPAAVRAQ